MSISLKNVYKYYEMKKAPSVHALNGISLEIPDGSMTAIMGPSGCGKSTLLNIIAGIDRPTSGRVVIDGIDITKSSDATRSRIRNTKIGYVLQSFELIDSMTVHDNVALPTLFSSYKTNRKEGVNNCLQKVDMNGYDGRLITELSGGQKQRIAIARSLIMNPSIILADEPTGALDSKTAQQIMEVLLTINQDGRTIIIVTHNPEIAQYCNQQYMMLDGRIYQN